MFRTLSSVTWSDNFCYPNSGCAFSSPGCPSGDGGDLDLDHDLNLDQRNSNRTDRSKVGTGEDRSVLGQGVYGGPMVLHDQRLRTMVVAPLDHFHREATLPVLSARGTSLTYVLRGGFHLC